MSDQVDLYDEDTLKGKFLIFSLGNEMYGLEIQYVTEIIGIQTITEVPQLPDYIKGIINLRGKIIPVMDVRMRFKKEYMEYNDRTCIIVFDIQSISIGLIVDSVVEVLAIPDEEVVPPPELRGGGNKYIKGIAKTNQIILLLDCDKLLDNDELYQIDTIGQ